MSISDIFLTVAITLGFTLLLNSVLSTLIAVSRTSTTKFKFIGVSNSKAEESSAESRIELAEKQAEEVRLQAEQRLKEAQMDFDEASVVAKQEEMRRIKAQLDFLMRVKESTDPTSMLIKSGYLQFNHPDLAQKTKKIVKMILKLQVRHGASISLEGLPLLPTKDIEANLEATLKEISDLSKK